MEQSNAQHPSHSAQPPSNELTKKLCAAIHACEGLADWVVGSFLNNPRGGWAPCYAADATALLRHACAARRLRRVRDVAISMQILVVVAALAGLLTAGRVSLPGILLGAVLLLGWVWARPLGRRLARLARRAWPRLSRRKRRGAGWLLVLLAGLGGLVFVAIRGAGQHPAYAAVAAGCLALALPVIVLEAYLSRSRALRVRDGPDPRSWARPVSKPLEERLDRLPQTNVIVFGARRAQLPFVGNGMLLDRWELDINVFLGAAGSDGKRREPDRVDQAELYEFLEKAFDVEGATPPDGSAGFWAGYRMYADGSQLRSSSIILPTRLGPPIEYLPRARMLDQAWRLENEEHQRVYFCLQMPCRDGTIVVALFVRPYLQGSLLFVEFGLHALLPLHPPILDEVGGLLRDRRDRFWEAVGIGASRFLRTLLDAPRNCCADIWWNARRLRRARIARKAVRRNRRFDFGAVSTAREGVAMVDLEKLSDYEWIDLVRHATYLHGQANGVIKRFLETRGIDATEFEKAGRSIVNNIQNWKIGDVKANTVGLGNQNTFVQVPEPSKTAQK